MLDENITPEEKQDFIEIVKSSSNEGLLSFFTYEYVNHIAPFRTEWEYKQYQLVREELELRLAGGSL